MTIDITSTSNPKIKWLKSLHNNSTRRKEGVFLVEGAKEVGFAVDGGYFLRSLFVCPEINSDKSTEILKQVQDGNTVTTISRECYEKVAYRGSSSGIIGVFQEKHKSLDELTFGDNPLFIVLESVEKPGNLGAIIRTADGVGADGVIICDPKTDIFNPNVIRSSVGTVFTKQTATSTSDQLLDFLQKHEITIYSAQLSDDAAEYTQVNMTGATAILLGTEHEGLSPFWQQHATPITIPMRGTNDSLNVSNAAAVLAYEALRQRDLVISG